MATYIADLIDELISAWGEWRDAQIADIDKELVDDVFMTEYLKLDDLRDMLG